MLTTLNRLARALGLSLGLSLTTTALFALDLHVAPDGNDAWSGKLARPNSGHTDGPLATLTGARDAVRKLKAAGPLAESVRILVADGQYTITEPLQLGPEDSGTEKTFITYQAQSGAKPVFSGGRQIRGWQQGENGLWTAQVPEVAAGKWYFEQLFVNGQRATRARTPNKFWYYMLDLQEDALGSEGGRRPKQARQTVWLRPEDFKSIASLKHEELKDVNLVVYHNWDNTRHFLEGIDPKEQSITTLGEGMKPWNPWRKNSQFVLENALEFLDAPGEWFLSRTGTLYYKPLPGEKMTKADVVAPVAEKFLVIKGDPAANQFVEHLRFKGLIFQHGQWLTPPGGFEPMQAAAAIEASVMADGARHVEFEECEIGHVGIYGLWFRKGCRDDAVRHCFIHDFGAGALRVGETGIAKNESERTSHITLDNNILLHGGYIFPCATGLWVGQSGDNTITHNEIADLFYTGISTGWTWGYGDCLAKRNQIEFNHVHHLGWGLLSDMGGIYTLGPSEGTVLRNNVFHDIYAYSYGGWGMYTDEGSTGILFENNLVYDTKTGSFHQHYGKENIIRNNILVNSKEHQIQATRVENHLSFTFENNIVYWTNSSPVLSGQWEKGRQISRNNCYWNTGGTPPVFAGKSLADWQATLVPAPTNAPPTLPDWANQHREQGSIIANPRFENAARHDFRLADDSPALKLGFKPFDYTQAGVYGDSSWKAKAKSIKYPPLEIAPEPSYVPMNYSFERDAVGKTPRNIGTHVEGNGDSIIVTDQTAAAGKRSLKITSGPGPKSGWKPHVCQTIKLNDGQALNTFDLRLETGAAFSFEWRDQNESPYQTGPRFTVRDGKLRVAEKELLNLPTDQWIHVEVSAGIGSAGNNQWTLAVTLPDQPVKEFKNLEFASAKFKKLTWFGFSNSASKTAVYYLDNITAAVK